MDFELRRIAQATSVRPATREDLDELVQHTWEVAAEGRWIGTEVPFDREERRKRFDRILQGFRRPSWSPIRPLAEVRASSATFRLTSPRTESLTSECSSSRGGEVWAWGR